MKEGKIKFAVIGVGHIGIRHATMISRNSACELVALVDINESKRVIADDFNVSFYRSVDELVQSSEHIDVVNVCTPNHLHVPISIIAVENGCDVVCEKPMGLSRANCEELILKSKENHKLVFGVMQNRYSPPSAWLKELVDSGKLGDIYMVQVNCFWNRDARYYKSNDWKGKMESDGGTLYTQFSHFIDVVYWLFGDIENIKTTLKDFNHQEVTDFEDSGNVTFDFKNGGIGSLSFSTAVWNKNLESSITIIAENGSVKVGGQYMDEVEYCHVKDYEMPELLPTNPANDYGNYKGSAANHQYIIENVVETLKGNAVETTNIMEAMKVVDIIERIYKAGRESNFA